MAATRVKNKNRFRRRVRQKSGGCYKGAQVKRVKSQANEPEPKVEYSIIIRQSVQIVMKEKGREETKRNKQPPPTTPGNNQYRDRVPQDVT